MLVERIKKKININDNKKNVAKISIGTLMGQAISFITLPILTRIYGASVIGTWTLFNSIAIIVNSFSDLGLSNSIMMEENEENMKDIYKVTTSIVIAFSFLGSLITLLYLSFFNIDSNLNKYFITIFMFTAIFTLQEIQICYTWLNRKAEYNILMKNPIINNSIFGIVAILLGVFGFKEYGYFLGWILGQIVTFIHMKSKLPKEMIAMSVKEYKKVIKNNEKFIKYQLPTNVIGNVKNQIPVLGIKIMFGEEILGYYSIVVKLLQIPISLLASAMGRVFFQTVSDMKRKGIKIGEYVYDNIKNVTKVAAIPLIVILAFGDYLVIIFLGGQWRVAGDFMRILVFQNFFMFLMATVQGIAITLDKQKLAMLFSCIQSIGFILGLTIGKYIFNNSYIGIASMATVFVVCNIVYFCILFKAMNISPIRYLKSVLICIFNMTLLALIIRMVINIGLKYINVAI